LKISAKQHNVERSNVHGEGTFSIKQSPKAFEILSSGIYTDPIGAMVRELSCNAFDAHVAAKKQDIPFEIHLPNSLEPFFSVTDHGIGLSDEQIRGELVPVLVEKNGEMVQVYDDNGDPRMQSVGGLYTTYFDSTKTSSNDFIGALGLGSKSPFSYAPAFDVVSRYNGTRYIYSVFLNEQGVPSVALMGETPTIEHNGVEVRIAVKSEDFRTFKDRTASMLRFFPTKPTVIGVANFEFDQLPENILHGSNWFVTKKKRAWGSSNTSIVAVQGNVPYYVDPDKLVDLQKYERELLSYTDITLFFEIGDLDVAASREEIRYDKVTVANIVNAYRIAAKALIKLINDEADKYQDSLWEAYVKLSEYDHDVFSGNFIYELSPKEIQSPTLKSFIENSGTLRFSRYAGLDISGYAYNRRSYSSTRRVTPTTITNTIRPAADVVIMYNDCKRIGITRVRNYVGDTLKTVILLSPRKQDKIDSIATEGTKIVPFESYEKDLELINAELGNVKILKVSEATNPHEAKKTLTIKQPIYKYDGIKERGSYWNTKYSASWERMSTDDLTSNKKRLFFKLEHQSVMCSNTYSGVSWTRQKYFKEEMDRKLEIINKVHGTQYTIRDVYGASKSAMPKLEQHADWDNFFTMLDSAVEHHKDEMILSRRANATKDTLNLKSAIRDPQFIKLVKTLEPTSKFRILAEQLERAYPSIHNAANIEALLEYDLEYGKQMVCYEEAKPLYDISDFDDYPMLKLVSLDNHHQTVIDYIKIVDKAGEK